MSAPNREGESIRLKSTFISVCQMFENTLRHQRKTLSTLFKYIVKWYTFHTAIRRFLIVFFRNYISEVNANINPCWRHCVACYLFSAAATIKGFQNAVMGSKS